MNSDSLYIHVPFCRRRCPYCDFYFVVGAPKVDVGELLQQELMARCQTWAIAQAKTLYFGGGTPSLLKTEQLHRFIGYVRSGGMLAPDAEITVEANPEDINQLYIAGLRDAGVNRISLGVQSFNDTALKFLGRMHDGAMAKQAIDTVLAGGITNVSVDLIIGLPNENRALTLDSIAFLVDRIPHFSTYLLTIEQGTNFYKRIAAGRMGEPSEEVQVESYRSVQNLLLENGFLQYDISSYSKLGFFSNHNQVYWGMGGYLGIGPSAHSMRIMPDGGIMRMHNQITVDQWMKTPASDLSLNFDRLEPKEALKESLAFGLRNMHKGIEPNQLAARHGVRLPTGFFSAVEKLKKNNWLEERGTNIRITKEGALFADAVMREILCSE